MSKLLKHGLLSNVIDGCTAGGLIGAALDGVTIIGASMIGGPVGFAAASKWVASKTAIGTLVGGTAGVVKTVQETDDDEDLD